MKHCPPNFVDDPHIPGIHLSQGDLSSVELTEERLSSADCVVIATDHDSYHLQEVVAQSKLVFDTRGATRGLKQSDIIRLGE